MPQSLIEMQTETINRSAMWSKILNQSRAHYNKPLNPSQMIVNWQRLIEIVNYGCDDSEQIARRRPSLL